MPRLRESAADGKARESVIADIKTEVLDCAIKEMDRCCRTIYRLRHTSQPCIKRKQTAHRSMSSTVQVYQAVLTTKREAVGQILSQRDPYDR